MRADDPGLTIMMALVDASLIQIETIGAERLPRYQMLEVIHDYAREQLRVIREEDRRDTMPRIMRSWPSKPIGA